MGLSLNPKQLGSVGAKVLATIEKNYQVGYDVVEVTPDRDKKDEIYQLAGGTTGIAHQISQFMATREYIEDKFSEPEFKNFADNFELGFPSIKGLSPNFGKGLGVNPWNKDYDNRPRFNDLTPRNSDGKRSSRFLYVEFWPDRKKEDESYLLIGSMTLVIQQIQQIWHFKQLTEGLGQWLGYPPTEWLRRRPNQGLTVEIVLANYPNPPFYKSTERKDFKAAQISIPFFQKPNLNYDIIRAACGGNGGLTWGKHRAIAWVADDLDLYPKNKKGMPQMSACGSSYEAAKSNLKRFITLAGVKIASMSHNEIDKSEGVDKTPSLQGDTYKMYPVHMFIMNSRLLTFDNPTEAKKTRLGKLDTKKNKLPLWYQKKPEHWDERVNELTTWSQG